MSVKEDLSEFIKRIEIIIEERKERFNDGDLKEEWSENTYKFMEKYGHVAK